ncbi:glycosyltransferase [Paenibacillus sp. Soil750]|uniref:glycosyltransferase n=1 Tax=Paenibacillus sp. Soil750 TaxID=1736398 RepID=UPI000700BCC5|nr:glycosyltransferase [Paenibacillus sp. Soil750]KRE75539.1 hypothetical protein ASL11_01535 [Paenibacillus sp. Soil750]
MDEKISVIVPMYKVEEFLPGCMASILNQVYTNFEIILVNDGSPDNCGELAESYAARDKRIKVIHKANGGPSSARNAGIEAATGKYIVFIDSDDEVSSEYLNVLYKTAEQHQCDVVISGFQTIPRNIIVHTGFKMNQVMQGKELVLSSPNVHSNNDLCYSWRYFYRTSILKKNHIRFNSNVFIGEDVIFNLEYLLASERVIAIPDILYYYTDNNPLSVMRLPFKPELESSLLLQHRIRKQISEKFGLLKNKNYRNDMANYYIKNIYRLLIQNVKNSSETNMNNELRRVVSHNMIVESVKEIGFAYRCENLKEYIYYLALKFRVFPILIKVHNREFRGL